VREEVVHWKVTHYTAGDSASRQYTVRARNREAARRKLAAAIQVPLWTLR